MAKGRKTGGRKAGTPNRKTNLFAMCDEMKINVFEEMLVGASKETDPDKRFHKFKEIAPYLYAKKKEVVNLDDHTPEELIEAAEKKIDGTQEAS